MNKDYQSWAHYPVRIPARVMQMRWMDEEFGGGDGPLLSYGLGRSYSDCCLNGEGTIIATRGMRRFLAFDETTGVLRCEAGVSIEEVLALVVPRGWWLAVTPGTKYVTLGGAIANDVHGKNHYRAGTFGMHVRAFELVRSNGDRFVCSPQEEKDLFEATIGGLGLTGLITWVEIQLVRMQSTMVDMDSVGFVSLSEYIDQLFESEKTHDYMVAWLDGMSRAGRGILQRGNFAPQGNEMAPSSARIQVPFDAPKWLLNRYSIGLYNTYRFYSQRDTKRRVPYESFFYELDSIRNWNRLYGAEGFYQYQCVFPRESVRAGISELWRALADSSVPTFLVTSRLFGEAQSPGWLSFPRSGVTFAFDFPNAGEATLSLLAVFDDIVKRHHGALYPAKDARISPTMFAASFPQLKKFRGMVDPKFSSDFWRRVSSVI